MTRFILSFFGAIFTWATNGAFMGALVVGGVFWSYGRDLPNHEQLAQYTPPTISRVYSGEGRLMDEFARERRLFAPGEEIPELIKHAFISAEDKNFYVHSGYDVRGMAAAALQAARGGRLRGASTISQQVVKNFLLSSDRSAERKIKELILSIRLEQTLTKEQILELYLNEIFLGQNSYGVAAAAQTYFNKVLSELTAGEAAYLAALAQRPGNLHPIRQHEAAINRRNYVLREMLQNGFVDQAMHDVAREEPLRTVQNGDFESFRAQLPYRDYFTDEIRRQLSRDFGEEEFFAGGLTIRATVDPQLQDEGGIALREALEAYDRAQGIWHGSGERIADELLSKREDWEPALRDLQMPRDIPGWYPAVVLQVGNNAARIGIDGVADDDDGHWILAEDVTWASKELEDGSIGRAARVAGDLLEVGDVVMVAALAKPEDGSFLRWSLRQVPKVEGAFMAMDVNTGRVLAMQGGFSYQSSVFNRTTQATRQPGSSFKPFVYASALDSGFTPATIIVDAPIDFNTPEGIWRPKNAANRYYGPTPLRTGIEKSRNLMTIRLAQEVGMRTIANYAERFGVYDDFEPNLAGALGAQETTLFRMVAAYAMFANGGERVEPTLVDRVQDRRGKTIYRHDRRSCEDCQLAQLQPGSGPLIISNRERVMDAITAYQLTSMMEGVVKRGTAYGRVNLDVPVAGKTGTTNDARDVWFIGFTSNIVAGCYIGYDLPESLGDSAGGGSLCAPVFNRFMQTAVRRYGGGPFKIPPGGHFIKIDRFSGARLPDEEEGDYVQPEYFRNGEEPEFGRSYDGGFAMGVSLPTYAPGEDEEEDQRPKETVIEKATGEVVVVPEKADFGSLSSGGLY